MAPEEVGEPSNSWRGIGFVNLDSSCGWVFARSMSMKLVLAPQSTSALSDCVNSDSVVLRIEEFAEYEGSSAGCSGAGKGIIEY